MVEATDDKVVEVFEEQSNHYLAATEAHKASESAYRKLTQVIIIAAISVLIAVAAATGSVLNTLQCDREVTQEVRELSADRNLQQTEFLLSAFDNGGTNTGNAEVARERAEYVNADSAFTSYAPNNSCGAFFG